MRKIIQLQYFSRIDVKNGRLSGKNLKQIVKYDPCKIIQKESQQNKQSN